jgi:hypothetical protein
MRYPHHPGIGKRIKKQLVVLGFKTPEGDPDIGRFIRERGYDGRYFYRWANKDVTPAEPYLSRLCGDLGLSPAYLVFGEEGAIKPKRWPYPIGGGSSNDGTLALPSIYDVLPVIRLWIRRISTLWAPRLQPQWA